MCVEPYRNHSQPVRVVAIGETQYVHHRARDVTPHGVSMRDWRLMVYLHLKCKCMFGACTQSDRNGVDCAVKSRGT